MEDVISVDELENDLSEERVVLESDAPADDQELSAVDGDLLVDELLGGDEDPDDLDFDSFDD